MLIYIFLLIGFAVMGIPLCSEKAGKTGRAIYCAAAALVFIVVSALRFQVGYDYNLYGGTYFNMKYLTIEDISLSKMEKGFLLPLYVLNLAFEDYRTVFIYTSIIIYAAVFFLIYKNSSKPWISTVAFLCFGLYFNSLCFLRQFIAALIVAYAVKFIGEKQPLRFFVLVIAAASFHWSALIMLGMYFLVLIKPGRIYLGIVTVGTIIFCIFSRSLMYWAIDHFYMYSGYDPTKNVEAANGLPVRYTVMFGLLFIISFIFRKRLIEKNPSNSIHINCLMYTVVFEAMGTRHGVLSRFAIVVYLTPLLYLVPDLVEVIREFISDKLASNEKRKKLVSWASIGAASVFAAGCYIMLMLSNYNGTVPYISQMNRPTDIFVEEISDESTDDNWDDVDWDEEGYIDDEWEDEEWLEDDLADDELTDDGVINDGQNTDEGLTDDDLDDEDWDDENWDDDDWDEEFDQDAFEQDILNQLS